MEDFKLEFREGKLFAIVKVNGAEYKKDVTDYFEQDNPHDEWLDYRINLINGD